MSKKITMQHIADYLGVSKYVVSKAISGKEGVNPVTREKVYEVASQLGYFAQKNKRVNQIQLNKSDTNDKNVSEGNVLVLMPNIRFQTMESAYWGGIVEGIAQGLEKRGLEAVVVTETSVKALSNVLHSTDFLGVISVGFVSTALLLEIEKMKVPIVLIDYEASLLPCDTLFNNNFDSSMNLANYLIGIGHKKIQFVGDINHSRSFYDRWLGLRSALEGQDLPTDLKDTLTLDIFHIEEAFSNWLHTNKYAKETFPTALFCANDNIAARVITILIESGIKVPEDISVTGFDNKEYTYKKSPTITTVNIAIEDLGKRSVEMLLRRMKEKQAPFEKVMLAGTSMLRESTAVPRIQGSILNNLTQFKEDI